MHMDEPSRYAVSMTVVEVEGCPVEPQFDPLSAEFLADPFAVMASMRLAERPVFYAPTIDYYVITRYRDIEAIFSDSDSYSAAAAQLPLVELDPHARQILLDGGHRPQPSMVSLDPPDHTRLRRPTARAFSARRTAEMEAVIRATVVFSLIGVPEADYAQLKVWCGCRAKLAWGRPAANEQIEHARHMTASCLVHNRESPRSCSRSVATEAQMPPPGRETIYRTSLPPGTAEPAGRSRHGERSSQLDRRRTRDHQRHFVPYLRPSGRCATLPDPHVSCRVMAPRRQYISLARSTAPSASWCPLR
jgi:hypothetical protein